MKDYSCHNVFSKEIINTLNLVKKKTTVAIFHAQKLLRWGGSFALRFDAFSLLKTFS